MVNIKVCMSGKPRYDDCLTITYYYYNLTGFLIQTRSVNSCTGDAYESIVISLVIRKRD